MRECERGVAARLEDTVGAVGGDGGEDGEPEGAAELDRGVEQSGGDTGLVGWDAFVAAVVTPVKTAPIPIATTPMPGSRSLRNAPSTGV